MSRSRQYRGLPILGLGLLAATWAAACGTDETDPASPALDGSAPEAAPSDGGPGARADGAIAPDDASGRDGASDAAEAGGDASIEAGPDGGGALPEVWLYNLVSAEAEAHVAALLGASGDPDLGPVAKQFFQTYGDDYDFLYFLADTTTGTGQFLPVRYPATPSIGLPAALDQGAKYGSPSRLKGVAGMRLGPGNGPTIHETLHYWSQFLSPTFGFGREADGSHGPHWGHASVHGSHGGFDCSSLHCTSSGAAPTGSPPACPLASGRMKIDVALFEPGASNDTVAYQPIELYLMGLLPAAAITAPILVMDDPVFEQLTGQTLFFDVASFHEVTIGDIVGVHGARPPATQTSFRGAFVLVTSAAATNPQRQLAESWAKRFGGEGPAGGPLLSFAQATGGRATMTTRLGSAP